MIGGKMNIFRDNDLELRSSFLLESKRVDILSLLGEKTNHLPIVSKILSYLDEWDLVTVTKVSRTWQRFCLFDKASACRTKKYIAKRKKVKENEMCINPMYDSVQTRNESTPKKRRPLASWNENFNFSQMKQTPGSSQISPRRIRFNKFLKEAKKLGKNGKLTLCPQCTMPSTVNDEEGSGICTQTSCSFQFCLRCLCAYHKGMNCKYFITSSPSSSPSKASHHAIGSRQSRKALRRL